VPGRPAGASALRSSVFGAMRLMFTLYALFIASGLTLYLIVGLTHH
jgi:hypothetical protein